ncbi:hypothetical protein DFH29DRAFT_287719 [Suillus ampliporus]|nr:hypothetical protein DFH29DRAFT_287719 [Suillus ampliporus]
MNPPLKTFLGFTVGRSRSNPHLPVERGVGKIQPSSVSPSNEARRGPPGSVRKFFSKVIGKGRSTPPQTTQDPSPSTAPTPTTKPNPRSSNPGTTKFRHQGEQLDPTLVNERIADAIKSLAVMKNVPEMVEHTVSATNNPQPFTSDTINTFSSILGLLETFNFVANFIGDIHPSISVLYVANLRS